VRIDIPLFPFRAEVYWRPLRPFRFSLRALMVTVVVAALLLALGVQLGRLTRAGNYHAEQAKTALMGRTPGPPGAVSLWRWHSARSFEYRAAAERVDFALFVAVVATVSLVVLAGLGRLIHRRSRPATVSPPEGESGRAGAVSSSDAGRTGPHFF